MNNEQEELLDEAYKNYSIVAGMSTQVESLKKEEFINKCKTDTEFSERWGLKIEERELSDKERVILYTQKTNIDTSFFPVLRETLNFHNIPTKLITVTYNDKTIESYE
jgi:hypothetical protein